ncbi:MULTISPECIES: DNA/RNA nuclease SfsA [Leptospirillum]|uniref:Sugar fermentation stimulation protein homolog n=2 Tax=Leptospirillum ferriphilum TaxID=178606 RepID=A0A1V3SXN8_9BACT|nr:MULTISPECIES: DNA/RNA nuclease SfsA [Leptospirillum]EAY55815.1 MAG: Sugar fermentation stimulation protein [Leptospirillum rubarum]EIJ76916.1 MAG: Sugar fermentation stimulation protein [Leptospirillum sp. Group II 'C75']AFS53665.1 DNA-binding protein [Leptospirillum ferriphilum ML-04]AKS23378.1 hypothetical protein ABH19_05890 [Leptospirillum sp. Group II 'CF-1']OOH74341.1 hypothetical protein BOX24_02575 [Leptospirillum ferriphilum]
MLYREPLTSGTFVRREKRYSVLVRLPDGQEVWAHSPNPGRLLSCLESPGTPVYLSSVPEREKNPPKYRFRVEQSEPLPGVRVGINPLLANKLAEEVIHEKLHPALAGASLLAREVRFGDESRVDFLLEMKGKKLFLEVKSVTFREEDAGLFPDAVSERASRHLEELEKCLGNGDLAAILFIVQRSDVNYVLPADRIDPHYGKVFRKAIANGVMAFAMRVSPQLNGLYPEIPLEVRSHNS